MSDRTRHTDDLALLGGTADMTPHGDTGLANSGNALALIEACHRVVKKDGSMAGARACAASFRATGYVIRARVTAGTN